ncbi:MAG: lysophospholipid acyltransferase family protein [Planctomycetaceae bacterium]|nr:lysophospholipid acyltransferase family protein [Planctomycetaceae bacterium]
MRGAWRHRCEHLAFRLVVCLIECLPVRTSVRWAETLAWLIHDVLPRKWSRYAVSSENVRRALGPEASEAEVSDAVRRMWVHLFRTVVELVQTPRKLHLHSYRSVNRLEGIAPTVEALLSGRRVLLLAGHFGNWEIALAVFGIWGFPLGVVAREMDNPLLDDWFRRFRECHGHRLLPKKGGYEDMLEILRRGGNVALLCDQDAGSRGVFVDFFGVPASTFKSIALLALEYDALLVVGTSVRLRDDFTESPWARFEIRGEDVIDPRELTTMDPVREITQRYTAALERAIRRTPEQYFWVHRRWKSEPRQRPAKRRWAG